MIIVLKKESQDSLENIKSKLRTGGFKFDVLEGVKFVLVPVLGDFTTSDISRFRAMEGVENVLRISNPYYLVTKEFKKKTVIDLGDGVTIGDNFRFISGPCSVENEASLTTIAEYLSALGVKILRGGTFKMRSSPYSFQGLGKEGLVILRDVARQFGMKTVSEIVDVRNLDFFIEYTDIIQIGARNMYNFSLLKEVGRTKKPVMLKRSPSAKIEDFLLSSEYILSEGNDNVILCERGSTGFDDITRNSINIAAIPAIKNITHLPVFLDPSHGVGIGKFIPAVSEAAVMLGADGLMIETHFDPANALSDGFQSINFEAFTKLYNKVQKLLIFQKEFGG